MKQISDFLGYKGPQGLNGCLVIKHGQLYIWSAGPCSLENKPGVSVHGHKIPKSREKWRIRNCGMTISHGGKDAFSLSSLSLTPHPHMLFLMLQASHGALLSCSGTLPPILSIAFIQPLIFIQHFNTYKPCPVGQPPIIGKQTRPNPYLFHRLYPAILFVTTFVVPKASGKGSY